MVKILIVDPNLNGRKIIQKELETMDCELFEAEDVDQAIALFKEIRPNLVTIDLDMPKMGSVEIIQEIRSKIEPVMFAEEIRTPIIILSAADIDQDPKIGFEAGANDLVIKPFLKGELAAVINKYLNPEAQFKGLTALIADDSGLVRSILKNILDTEGINTIMAVDGKEAFNLFQDNEQEIDIVLTDFLMPNMDGGELCTKIRAEMGHDELPIILLSTLSERDAVIDLFKAGASDYVIKPFSKDELMARIKVHLKNRGPQSKTLRPCS